MIENILHFICCFWSEWEDGGRVHTKHLGNVIASHLIQRRTCSKCNKVQYRQEEVYHV